MSAFAQPATKTASADLAWQDIAAQVASTAAGNGSRKSSAQRQQDDKQRGDKFWQIADSAKNFYIQYPDHAKAAEARKLEATSALLGAKLNSGAKDQAALQVGTAYRNDRANLAKDRFEVAVLIEQQKYRTKNGAKRLGDDPREHEKIADSLHAEFGELPEVFGYYLGVARSADRLTATRIAQNVIAQPSPSFARAEAETILQRFNLIGKPVSFPCTALGGNPVAFKPQIGALTVICVWSPTRNPAALQGLAGLKGKLPRDTQWVYISLDSQVAALNSAKSGAPFPGAFVYDAGGLGGSVASALKVRDLPFAYIVNREGALTGFGRFDEVSGIVADANRGK